MKFRSLNIFLGIALISLLAHSATAAILYSSSFNAITDITGWTINAAQTANALNQGAITGFDYSTLGIPAAPGGSGTLGMRVRANVPGGDAAPVNTRPGGTISGLSVSPTAQNFGTVYTATFYAWSNFNGSANASGLADNANSQGGTNNVLFGVGTSGIVPMVVGDGGSSPGTTPIPTNASIDGIAFATTGDGGIANDYRIYPKSATFDPVANGNYNAASTSNAVPYYANLFPAVSAPAVQQTLSTAEYGSDAFNTQAGSTQAGAFGFAWHKVVIGVDGTKASWYVDDVPFGSFNYSSLGGLGGNNIALGQSDVNTSTTRHPSMLFTVFDNLVVTDAAPVPEPATASLVVLGLAFVCGLVRRRS